MSITFHTGDWSTYTTSSKVLGNMGNGRAQLFNELTQAVARYYRVLSGISTENDNDIYWVDEKQFCALVDAVFVQPKELAYSWAQSAASMYEIIKGQRFRWGWEYSELPFSVMLPYYSSQGDPPEYQSQQWIGQDEKAPSHSFAFLCNGAAVAQMDVAKASLFLDITALLANRYQVPNAVLLRQAEECVLDANGFAAVTEAVFANPHTWLYPWARYASGMYDVIKNHKYIWKWDQDMLPISRFSPAYCQVEEPERISIKSFGVG